MNSHPAGPSGLPPGAFPPRGVPHQGVQGMPTPGQAPFPGPPGGTPQGAFPHPQAMGHHPPPPQQLQPQTAQMVAQAMRNRHATDSLMAESLRGLKRGKPTSRSIPPSVQRHVPESALYGQMQKDERALDWTLSRKRAELTDGMSSRPPKVKRTLRIFLSNTCANQPFQKEEQATLAAAQRGQDVPMDASADASSSDADVPSWTLRIEGRLLEPTFRSRANNARSAQATSDRIGAQRFSNLVKSCVVELQRDPNAYPPEENLIEWHRPVPTAAPPGPSRSEGVENPLIASSEPGLDGFEIKRKGSEPVKVKIALYLSYTPERYALTPELGALLDIREETRQGVISALWGYIKDRKLLDERDRRNIRCDAPLANLFKAETIAFHHLPEVINRFLHPVPPVVLEYWVRTDVDVNKHASAYDIEVEMEDWSVRAKQERVLAMFDAQGDKAREIAELDEQIAQAVTALQNHSSARDFLHTFSQDPLGHLSTWLASQSRDLDAILGAASSVPGAGVTAGLSNEELRRAETFQGAWLDEAITGHVALDTARRRKDLEKWTAQQQQQQQQQAGQKDKAPGPGMQSRSAQQTAA